MAIVREAFHTQHEFNVLILIQMNLRVFNLLPNLLQCRKRKVHRKSVKVFVRVNRVFYLVFQCLELTQSWLWISRWFVHFWLLATHSPIAFEGFALLQEKCLAYFFADFGVEFVNQRREVIFPLLRYFTVNKLVQRSLDLSWNVFVLWEILTVIVFVNFRLNRWDLLSFVVLVTCSRFML